METGIVADITIYEWQKNAYKMAIYFYTYIQTFNYNSNERIFGESQWHG
jgi:hypothetical protein